MQYGLIRVKDPNVSLPGLTPTRNRRILTHLLVDPTPKVRPGKSARRRERHPPPGAVRSS